MSNRHPRSHVYAIHALFALAFGLLIRTVLFVGVIRFCFHSYDRVKDDYRDVLRFGSRVVDYGDVMPTAILLGYLIPAAFLAPGILIAAKRPFGPACSKRSALVAIAVGLGAEIVLWIFLWSVGMASHFTSGDAFDTGV